MPLALETDASPCGIGAVLSHTFPEGSVRPVTYAFRRLSSAEVNYSQWTEYPIFGVTEFHHYLYGRKFTLVTGHNPLPAMAPRTRRWAVTLPAYDYDITNKKGADTPHAEALSSLPLPDQVVGEWSACGPHIHRVMDNTGLNPPATTFQSPPSGLLLPTCCPEDHPSTRTLEETVLVNQERAPGAA